MRVKFDKNYTGYEVYKNENEKIDRYFNHYLKQLENNDNFKGYTVIKMLKDLKELIKIELE